MTFVRLKNVRCFLETGPVKLAPLTILVGENSTGKSSFLAFHRITQELLSGNATPDFNREPFFLGAYDQIAHYRGGRGGRAQKFQIEIGTDDSNHRRSNRAKSHLICEFVKHGSQPVLQKTEFVSGDYKFISEKTENGENSIYVEVPNGSGQLYEHPIVTMGGWFPRIDINFMRVVVREDRLIKEFERLGTRVFKKINTDSIRKFVDDLGTLQEHWDELRRQSRFEPYAIAPVRTRPERTYNPVDDLPRSEGSHVPMLLAKLRITDRQHWERIKKSIDNFGKNSGLFEELTLKTLGRSVSDPFQIMVKIAGPASNLIDVGYGVSQVLPIIVSLLEREKGRCYLLQQPEVHLHPKGQAALGTFLSEYVGSTGSHVIVETHSDYLIDRIRMEARDKKNLSEKDVAILYFVRNGLNVDIHNIEIDKDGNLMGAPESYGSFFLSETRRMFEI